VWRRVDSYLTGSTTIPELLDTPAARAALKAIGLFL
jgi:hypothetical protein